jgi:receptor expression-enhancing protein 5/6
MNGLNQRHSCRVRSHIFILFSTYSQDKTKAPKEYVVLAGALLFGILVFFGIGAATLCAIIGFVYPAYQSFLAIENKNKGDDVQWIVYWVLYSFFSIIETFQDFILYWIPFYFAFKLAFLLWAMLPQTRGAKFLYDSFLKDFLKKNGEGPSRIDSAMAEAKKVSWADVSNGCSVFLKMLKNLNYAIKLNTTRLRIRRRRRWQRMSLPCLDRWARRTSKNNDSRRRPLS